MPDIDPLAFGTLTHEMIGREARKLIRSLTEPQLEHLCQQVAKHLRLCGWEQRPPTPLATGYQYPPGQARGSAECLSGVTDRAILLSRLQ
jgi:hypothetical protein